MREYLSIFLIVAYLTGGIGIILFFGGELRRYKTAFRRVAAQLFDVTAERNAAEIKLAGCKRELTKERAKNERLMSETGSGESTDFHCPKCKTNLHYTMLSYASAEIIFQKNYETSDTPIAGVKVEPFDLSGDE